MDAVAEPPEVFDDRIWGTAKDVGSGAELTRSRTESYYAERQDVYSTAAPVRFETSAVLAR